MSSKPKTKTFIVLHNSGMVNGRCNFVLGRYKVGARTEKEAEDLVKQLVGKHAKVRVYYEDKKKFIPYGIVARE